MPRNYFSYFKNYLSDWKLNYVFAFRKISNTWLSTGWFTMTIALELCDRINVYGMVPPDFCRDPNHLSVPYHYYEPLGPDECTMYISHERGRKGSHHRFITEKRVFENWARTFNIHFFQPDWKPEPLTVNHPEMKAAVWGMNAKDCNRNHRLYQPSGGWTFWDSKATDSKRVTGFAADNCNKSGSSDGGVYREHFLLNCVLIRYIAFLAIWLPVRVCDLWKATRYHYRMGNSLWFFKVQHHWLFIVKTDGIYLMEVFMQPRPVFF